MAALHHHRTVFLSDLHLGALGGRSDLVLAFLQRNRAETYFLVGDILDLWQPLLPHWSEDDQRVLAHLRKRQMEGAKLHYLRGNHDPDPCAAPPEKRLDVPVQSECIYTAGDGRQYLVLHGDVVDARMFRSHILTRIGSRIDHGLRRADSLLRQLLRRDLAGGRSTIAALLARLNNLVYRNRRHEDTLLDLAIDRGLDGVICGHFHIPNLMTRDGVTYANCGDWMDSMSAICESHNGKLSLVTVEPRHVEMSNWVVTAVPEGAK